MGKKKPFRRSASGRLEDVLYPTLDLHGYSREEAVRSARFWINERRLDRESTVRLITGRGLRSAGPAVLPPAIEELLQSLRGDSVRSFERETGGGSYRIRLVPLAPAGRARTPPPPRNPRLVRQAEESLAELGIRPTPETIEAEIRRIIDGREPEKF